jgi:membrane associated rhomboid family serine protease
LKAWLGACALLAGGSAAVAWTFGISPPASGFAQDPLAWHSLGWVSRPWTLWTSAWIHTSPGSLAGNLLAIAALAVAGAALGAGRRAALALLAAWPLGTLALALWPEVLRYGGLGGPIHAAAAVLGLHLASRAAHRPLSVLLFAGLALKLLAERAWVQPVAFDPGWGFNVVYAAHLTGTLAGAACGALAALLPEAEAEADS